MDPPATAADDVAVRRLGEVEDPSTILDRRGSSPLPGRRPGPGPWRALRRSSRGHDPRALPASYLSRSEELGARPISQGRLVRA